MRNCTVVAVLLVLFIFESKAQTPFTTLVKEPRFLVVKAGNRKIALEKADVGKVTVTKSTLKTDSTVNGSPVKSTIKNDFDFFKSNSLALSLFNKGENSGSISSQVLYYKLYVANPTDVNEYRLNRYNIPLMIISKLSTNYDSLRAYSAIDVLDYEAAPVSIRVMPSLKWSSPNYKDVLYFGFYADLRGINLPNPTKGTTDMEFIGSGGIGFTYQGDGSAGTYNANGEYEEGRYSFSLMLQAATAKTEVLSRLFNTDKSYVSSIQGYFLFKVSDRSKLNVKVSYQHFFQEMKGGVSNNFSFALGI
jgi:hypothetical protein